MHFQRRPVEITTICFSIHLALTPSGIKEGWMVLEKSDAKTTRTSNKVFQNSGMGEAGS